MEFSLETYMHTRTQMLSYISTLFQNIGMPMITQRSVTFRNPDPQCLDNASATFKAAFTNPHMHVLITTSPLGKHLA